MKPKPTLEQKRAFHQAAQDGDLAKVKRLMSEGVSVRTRGKLRATALGVASAAGKTKVVAFLIKMGADVDAKDCNEHTPICYAAYMGYRRIVRRLIEAGASLDVEMDQFGILSLAVISGSTETLGDLIDHGVDVAGEAGEQAFWLAVHRRNEEAALKLLRAGLNARGFAVSEQIVNAAGKGLSRIVNALLRAGVDPDIRDELNGETAAMAAERERQKTVLKVLQKWRPTLTNVKRMFGAIESDNIDLLKKLISNNVDLNSTDANGINAVFRATELGRYQALEVLLRAGASANASRRISEKRQHHLGVSSSDESALSISVNLGDIKCTKLLIKYGAEIDEVCHAVAGQAILLGEQDGRILETIDCLVEAGLDPDYRYQDAMPLTEVLKCAKCGSSQRAKELLRKMDQSIQGRELVK